MRKIFETSLFKYGFLIMLYVAAFIIGWILLEDDFGRFFGWFFTFVAAGVVFFPFSFILFGRFRDMGILFSSVLGIGFMSWLSWMLSSIGFIPFTSWGCSIIMLICAGINAGILFALKYLNGSLLPKNFDLRSKIMPMLITGLVFLVVFISWTYIRGFKPEALGSTESVMDFAYMKSLDRSYYMPATDMWMAGKSFNYYYVGQYIATFLSKVSGVGVSYGYNLMLTTVAALAFALPYSLVSNVFSDHVRSKGLLRNAASHAAGLISGIAVSLCGNFHYLIYNYVVPAFRDIIGLTQMAKDNNFTLTQYFFPNSTRYIGYNPSTTSKTIHEFPSYSFVIGDLHAHVINIMFVLCVVAVLYAYISRKRDRMQLAAAGLVGKADRSRPDVLFGIEHFFAKAFDPCVLVTAFFIGLFHTTNYWDYPIYFVVAGAVILYVNFTSEGGGLAGIVLTVFHAAVVIIVSKLVCLPFTISFDQISSELAMVDERTPLYQFLVLWGFPFLMGIVFIVFAVKSYLRTDRLSIGQTKAAGTNAENPEGPENAGKKKRCGFIRLIMGCPDSDLFFIILILCAMGLTLVPELIYVKDIYTGEFRRANTMFKITYQAFVIFGVSFGYIFARLLIFGKKKMRVFGMIALCLLLLSAGYSKLAIDTWFFSGDKTYTGLSATAFLENGTDDEYEAIRFLEENVTGRPVIIEANGDSYTTDCRFSAWTGLPTILGWTTHEWLWRSSGDAGYPPEMAERRSDIKLFYTSDNEETQREIIKKYNISFIIIGRSERSRFGEELRPGSILKLGNTVFRNDTVTIIQVTDRSA